MTLRMKRSRKFGKEKGYGENTSQIKFPPVRKDEIEDEEDLADLEQAIGEIESVADIDMVSRLKEEKTPRRITGRRRGESGRSRKSRKGGTSRRSRKSGRGGTSRRSRTSGGGSASGSGR